MLFVTRTFCLAILFDSKVSDYEFAAKITKIWLPISTEIVGEIVVVVRFSCCFCHLKHSTTLFFANRNIT